MSGTNQEHAAGGGTVNPNESLNGNEELESADGFKDMMDNIVGSESHYLAHDDDEAILKALEDVEVDESFAPPISAHVAEAFNKTGIRKLSKETEDRLKLGMKIPENCKSFKVPKVNPEIWQNLRTRPRVNDLKLQQTQGGLSVALTALASISDKIAAAATAKLIPKDMASELLKMGLDSCNLIGHQMQEITSRRRSEIKPYLNPDYAGICNSQIPPSEYLFGDNLTDTLKSTKAAATVLRNTALSRHRTAPYNINQRPAFNQNLNYQRPFPNNRGRWNGFRPRGNFSRQYQQQRPNSGNYRQKN